MTHPLVNPAEYVTATARTLQSVAVVEVSGEIDMATRAEMADPVFAQLDAAPPSLVIDLTKVEFMGSAGLAVLIEAHERAQQADTRLGIVVPGSSVALRCLTISGLLELLPIHPTMADAMRSVGLDEPETS
jgi:anti-sigma B factor antagonist